MQTLPEKRIDAAGDIRILVVDDEEGARITLTDVLEDMGYIVQSAANATTALTMAAEQPFDIALLDMRLPDMMGTELLKRLKTQHPDIACVMVTAYASVTGTIEALNEGASAYVTKPFEIPEITTVIREQAEKQHLARENQRMVQALTAIQSISDIALSILDLEALSVKLLDRVISAVGGKAGALVMLDEELDAPGVPVSVGEADGQEALRAMRERAPILSPTEDAATHMALPLLVRGECIGGLQINATEAQPFARRDLNLAALLTDRAALALENARLHARERRSAREAHTLSRVAEALVSKLHLDERLLIIARTLAKVTGCARCLLFLRREGRLMSACAYGITADETETFNAMGTDLLKMDGTLRQAVEGARIQTFTCTEADTDNVRAFMGLWRAKEFLVVPLTVGSEAIGVALVDTPDHTCAVTPRDIQLCEAVANQAAVAIENARVFERERNVAEVLQKSFLPSVPNQLGSLHLAARYYPALAEAQVGGDFYDIIEYPDGRVGLLMADVSGKGVAAAVHAAMGKYMLRAFAFEHPDPADALRRLNAALFAYSAHEVFITMFFAVIQVDTGEMRYVNAGHPPALIVRASNPNRTVRLGSTGAPMGAFRNAPFAEDTARMEPGDLLVLYTDGVIEARSGPDFFGVEGLEGVLAEYAASGTEVTADAIRKAAEQFSGGRVHDDIALVLAQTTPGPG